MGALIADVAGEYRGAGRNGIYPKAHRAIDLPKQRRNGSVIECPLPVYLNHSHQPFDLRAGKSSRLSQLTQRAYRWRYKLPSRQFYAVSSHVFD